MADFCNGSRYAVSRVSAGSGNEVKSAFQNFTRIATQAASVTPSTGYDDFKSGWAATALIPYGPVNLPPFTVTVPDPNAVEIIYTGPEDNLRPPNVSVGAPKFTDAPEADIEKPDLYDPNVPGGLTVSAPQYDVQMDPSALPTEPRLDLPSVPVFSNIRLPKAGPLNLVKFTGQKPDLSLTPPNLGFDYVEPEYVSAMRDAVAAKIIRIMEGGLALSDGFWRQITQRLFSDQAIATQREVAQAQSEWALRGWSIPGGPMVHAVSQARDRGAMEEAKAARDVFIRRTELEVDNIKFAVVQGLAWETINVQLFNAIQDRLLMVARERIAAEKAILDARIDIFVAQKDFWIAEAQVHAQLIQAELAKIEIFKAEIQAQSLLVQIDESKVRMYVAQVEAATKVVDVYRTQVEAARVITENNRTKVMAWAEQVRAYEAVVRAWGTEWEAYRSAHEANRNKVQMFATEWDAFRTQVQAYSEENATVKIQSDSDVARAQLQVQAFEAEVRKYAADVQGASAQVEALGRQASANADYTRSLTDLERIKVEAQRALATVAVEQSRAASSIDTENARIAAAQIAAQQELAFKATDSQIRVLEQRIASALSGINVGAQISDSVNWGMGTTVRFGCDTNYNVQAEA